MGEPANDDNGLADGIFGTDAYEASSPQRKTFLPWHRPRKQYVRDYQWCQQIKKLLDEGPRDDNTLKYFGLPGVDLLDLRLIYRSICKPRKIQLRFLGFNSGANPASDQQVELNISLDEVLKLDLVDPGSDIIGDDFRLVANRNSKAWGRTQDLGPYDVINIDLCDGFASHIPGTFEQTHYNALHRLMTLQTRYKYSWLLLLTTRAGREHVHPKVLQILLRAYLANLESCAEFKAVSNEIFDIENEDTLKIAAKSSNGLLRVFLASLCKWFVSLAANQQPQSKAELKSVIGYKVDERADHEDLISLAIRFDPLDGPVDDRFGLASTDPPQVNECSVAVKVLRRINKRKDADAILRDDPELNDRMAEATANLLEDARYDKLAYRKWLAGTRRNQA